MMRMTNPRVAIAAHYSEPLYDFPTHPRAALAMTEPRELKSTGLKVTALAISKLFVPARLSADYSYRQLSGVQSLAEAGVKIDLLAAHGVGVIAALCGAIDGGARLWSASGLSPLSVLGS